MTDNVQGSLLAKFPYLEGKIKEQRQGRIFLDPLQKEQFWPVFDYIIDELGYKDFHMLVGRDSGETMHVIYLLTDGGANMLCPKLEVEKENPVIRSIYSRFSNCTWHELELVDLLGFVVEGLPEGLPNYPLPDGWPKGSHPLRKDWKVEYFNKETLTYNPPSDI
ncbi:MAG: NADH-quinone oxidoreductase subunit C [Clostridiales bacterium]|jgi:Ni,Fe-hydrogenase III component G|nr:NADH-quinone oxidoreductase subunit C [Clostridiales bacterium]